jgi:hypothetical protein
MLNSRDEWEARPPAETATFGVALVRENDRWRRALTLPRMLEGIGTGNLCRLHEQSRYGRELPVATLLASGKVALAKWLKKAIRKRGENAERPTSNAQRRIKDQGLGENSELRKLSRAGSPTPNPPSQGYGAAGAQRPMRLGALSREEFEGEVRPLLPELVAPGTIVDWVMRRNLISIRLDYANVPVNAHIDSAGKALIEPPERQNLPDVCRTCDQFEHDKTVAIVNSPAYAWRYLGLVEPEGTPTTRGVIFSFFHGGEGLAIAAALEDETYPISDLVFDLANVRAGPRFSGEDAPMGGRLGILCQRVYSRADYPGYLTMGVPVQYGAGASEVVRELVADPRSKHKLIGDLLRHGDIERALVEWRSLLRRIITAPPYPLPRWNELKRAAGELLEKTVSPTVIDLAGLLPVQQRRV